MRYGELAVQLHAAGCALPNLGSLPHISVAGACATGTHGSGDAQRQPGHRGGRPASWSPPTATCSTCDRDADAEASPARWSASARWAWSPRLTLDIVPTFEVRQYVYEGLPAPGSPSRFDEIIGRGLQRQRLHRLADGPAVTRCGSSCATGADAAAGPLAGGARWPTAHATRCARHARHLRTAQLGAPGPWHERLPHFRLEFTPSSGDELQSRVLRAPRSTPRPRSRAGGGSAAASPPRCRSAELRTVAADELWLSPAQGRDSVAFHFTWRPEEEPVSAAVAALEEALAPFAARPHWGKVFATPPAALAACYPRYDDFRRLRAALDPSGRFANEFIDRYVPPAT